MCMLGAACSVALRCNLCMHLVVHIVIDKAFQPSSTIDKCVARVGLCAQSGKLA